ncbi:hypothetical protein ZWY2020_043188 [Hordeum vulgare]|nr:hypothetical protein ZWY2020_043188 [Hordeum vulgare]
MTEADKRMGKAGRAGDAERDLVEGVVDGRLKMNPDLEEKSGATVQATAVILGVGPANVQFEEVVESGEAGHRQLWRQLQVQPLQLLSYKRSMRMW